MVDLTVAAAPRGATRCAASTASAGNVAAMDTTAETPDVDPAVAAVRSDAAAALAALRALREALDAVELPRDARPDLTALARELSEADVAAMHAVERFERRAAGMVDEPDWCELGERYTEVDPSWAVEVLDDHERYPQVALCAPSAPEANRRAVAWGTYAASLSSPIPVDGPRARLAGGGTIELTPGRWRVELEGW